MSHLHGIGHSGMEKMPRLERTDPKMLNLKGKLSKNATSGTGKYRDYTTSGRDRSQNDFPSESDINHKYTTSGRHNWKGPVPRKCYIWKDPKNTPYLKWVGPKKMSYMEETDPNKISHLEGQDPQNMLYLNERVQEDATFGMVPRRYVWNVTFLCHIWKMPHCLENSTSGPCRSQEDATFRKYMSQSDTAGLEIMLI